MAVERAVIVMLHRNATVIVLYVIHWEFGFSTAEDATHYN